MGKCISLGCLARWRRTVTSSAAPWLERITGSGHQRTGPPTREPGLVATPVSTVNDLSINAIAGSSASDIWAVGQTVTAGYHNRQFSSVIMHYNGSTWSTAPIPSGISPLTGTASLAAGHVWFTGDYVTSADVTEPAVLSTSGGCGE